MKVKWMAWTVILLSPNSFTNKTNIFTEGKADVDGDVPFSPKFIPSTKVEWKSITGPAVVKYNEIIGGRPQSKEVLLVADQKFHTIRCFIDIQYLWRLPKTEIQVFKLKLPILTLKNSHHSLSKIILPKKIVSLSQTY